MTNPTLRCLAAATILVLGYTPAAHAYIDPTAAGAALQSMYVMGASALMAVVMVPRKVTGLIDRVKGLFAGHGQRD